jgi:hypothetical protein
MPSDIDHVLLSLVILVIRNADDFYIVLTGTAKRIDPDISLVTVFHEFKKLLIHFPVPLFVQITFKYTELNMQAVVFQFFEYFVPKFGI